MAFKGTRVFISRKVFPPQVIDSLHDTLKENGAEVCICSNPSCNASTDFHVLPSSEHEKVAELRSQGCNVIGPECLIRCAKEHRSFPKQGYTCCLAMEGVRVLATGFEKLEKLEIERLVTSMCGELETKISTDISFIIAKNVLAAKYKSSVNNLSRPILKIDWLFQCWREHRLVPHEPYRLLPFTGLTICATNVPLDERKEIEELSVKNGGIYSADLTKKCTHLIAYLPEGDKYRVAKRWGNVRIVNRYWFNQCVTAKACLDEDLFPVHVGLEKPSMSTQLSGPPLASPLEVTKFQVPVSSAPSRISNTPLDDDGRVMENSTDGVRGEHSLQDERSINFGHSLEDSACQDDDMYLSNCRIYFVGFTAPELRKFVNMVRDGGGTRHMEFNDRVTHVIVGRPTASELKEIRQWTMWGAIQVLWPSWLEECTQQKKELAINKRHLIPDGLLLKGFSSQETSRVESTIQQLSGRQQLQVSQNSGSECSSPAINMHQNGKAGNVTVADPGGNNLCFTGVLLKKDLREPTLLQTTGKSEHLSRVDGKEQVKMAGASHLSSHEQGHIDNLSRFGSGSRNLRALTSHVPNAVNVFKGYVFAFSDSFPADRREEIIHWIVQGGGVMENEVTGNITKGMLKDAKTRLNFTIVSHGMRLDRATFTMNGKPVSSHWIRYCLEEGKMLDPESHVLYQPLQCQVPLPGFEILRFCVSQYEDKDRLLLRNLCYVLGAKFTEKLNRKVTHLLCKVRDGQKFEAAHNWGIQVITAEWLFACVAQDKLPPLDDFRPRELSAAEQDAGLLAMTQCPTQAARLASGELGTQWEADTQGPVPTQPPLLQSGHQELKSTGTARSGDRTKSLAEASMAHLSHRNKHVRTILLSQSSPSQVAVASLDPWDEQTIRWSGGPCDDTKQEDVYLKSGSQENSLPRRTTRGQQKSHVEAGSSSPCKITTVDEGRLVAQQDAVSNTPGELVDLEQRMEVVDAGKENHENWNPSSDVAAAIEGLLAQTSKVKCNDTRRKMEVDQELLSPEHTTIKRNREEESVHSEFKRPKQWQSRVSEKSEEAKVSSSPAPNMHGFDESQMDSQVIGYDEDHTGKQMIMERVRTRSMSTTDGKSSLRRGDKAAAWKNDGLGRLFKVAEANKR